MASAQQWRCYPFLQGETAAGAAARIAGDAGAFEILDLSVSRFVPKNRYGRIRSSWVACTWVMQQRTSTRLQSAVIQTGGRSRNNQPDPLWYVLVLVLVTPWGAYEVNRRLKVRRAVIAVMTQFGNSIVQEFERPLVQSRDPRRALRSRLRFQPLRNRVQVLLAPAPGRTYPNLSDHKKNVEYDIERVRQILGDTPYVNDSVRQRGDWVVLGFRARVVEPGLKTRPTSTSLVQPGLKTRPTSTSVVGRVFRPGSKRQV
jgi:hypothetical protein